MYLHSMVNIYQCVHNTHKSLLYPTKFCSWQIWFHWKQVSSSSFDSLLGFNAMCLSKYCAFIALTKFLYAPLYSFTLKRAQSKHFELFWARTNLPLIWRRAEDCSLLKLKKNTKKIINHKGRRMTKIKKWMTNWTNLGETFEDLLTVTS